MSDEDKKNLTKIIELEKKIKEFEDNQKKLVLEKEESDKRLKEFKKEQAEKQEKQLKEEVKSFCEEMVKQKRLLPSSRDKIIDPENMLYFSDHGVVITFSTLKKVFKEQQVILETREFASGGPDGEIQIDLEDIEAVNIEVDRLIREYASIRKVEYKQAKDAILADPKHKEIVNAYVGKR